MATPEEEIKDLKEKNNELVQKVQYWKMTAGQRENEKVALMKEINELRLKLSRVRSNGNIQACKLDAELQSASEKALAHLVRASGEIARTIDLTKAYMRDRQEPEIVSPRWSSVGSTPNSDKVHRVPPTMMGGQSIQPVVALSRTMFNTSNNRSISRSPAQNRSVTERAVPMHMLQDVYIPLTRIDMAEVNGASNSNSMDTDVDNPPDNSTEDLGLDDSDERALEDSHMSDEDNFESSRRLDAVTEDVEPDEDVEGTPTRTDNPLEGPSWLLDPPNSSKCNTPKPRVSLEPDSTTDVNALTTPGVHHRRPEPEEGGVRVRVSCEFSPTVRRRRRASSPERYSPRPASLRRNSTSGRVLKVLVAKLRLEGEEEAGGSGGGGEGEAGGGGGDSGASPPKRPMRIDAPSPNGATDAGVVVSEATKIHDESTVVVDVANVTDRNTSRRERRESRESRYESHTREQRTTSHVRGTSSDSRATSHDSRDSDSGSGGGGGHISEGRTRRPRKAVTYKEKPLNRKMRR